MPVDIYICPQCGGFEFVQAMQLHVAYDNIRVSLVEQVATPVFKCLQCGQKVELDEEGQIATSD